MAVTDIDEAKLEAFIGHAATELGAALNTALVTLGEELGLYKAMADGQPVTAAELAARTGTVERYVGEWLNTQAASGFVVYEDGAYVLPPEHALVLADEASPYQMLGSFQAANAAVAMRERIAERFVDGDGVGWHEHHHDLFHGTERAFATSYRNFLVSEWLPALDGVVEKLEAGALVADIGCGHGASSIQLAQAFPNSRFVAIDYHVESIEIARERAAIAGVADRIRFEVAGAAELPGEGYDLIAFFDALHDLGDPLAAARAAAGALAPDGTCMIVEPFAGDSVTDNLNPVGRFYYGFSTLVCTPGSLSQPGRAGLGTQAGEARLAEVLIAGGFSSVRRAAESPLNLVLEARLA
jgi:2-polyprenyl-3-methyl-5-hydroxy-6-metoxy-1,4-benzoquinol methylase